MNELPDDLAKALAALDARAADAAARVDAERVADRVLHRLRHEPVTAVPTSAWTAAVRLAAVVALLAAGGLLLRTATRGDRAAAVSTLPVYVPESLTAQQAAAALDAVSAQADSTGTVPAVLTVEDLDAVELQALLRAMQSDMEGTL